MASTLNLRRLLRRVSGPTPARTETALRANTEAVCAATTFVSQTHLLIELFSRIWLQPINRAFTFALTSWVGMLEQDSDLRSCFQQTWKSMLGSLNSVPLFAEAGLPGQHALLPEITRRLFQRLLPSPREDADTARLFAAVFASPRAAQEFLDMDAALFTRLALILWDEQGLVAFPRVRNDLHQALRLLAARVSGRGTSVAVRERSASLPVEQSPFYALVFATERFIESEDSEPAYLRMEHWLEAVYACRGELALVRLHMEDAGVSTALVFDLSAMDAALDRMEMLAATLAEHTRKPSVVARLLLNTLVCGLREDIRVTSLVHQNLNLLARKTVERTGHGGEHYIAHTRWEYWHMWGAAIGGGLLTVFTAAIKLHIIGREWPPFIEAILVGTNYAISFLLLQIFGLALATKQPSMTAAALADIIRRNRGDSRRDKITDFGASISRTQLAAALGNILAVCSGAIVFDQVWRVLFHSPYLPASQAEHVHQSLRPLASATAIDAALTGILLWLAGLIGGWCENFAVYHRIPASIAQHPLGRKIGARRMRNIADWFDRNIAAWSNSIALGYLLGFTPVIAEFFGLPLDIRHVTLNTGMFAFAAARYGLSSFTQLWLYSAMVGIAVMFVLNLGVSFIIASYVALRAYDVGREERLSILRYALKQIAQSPLRFLFLVEPKPAAADLPEGTAGQPAPSGVEEPAKSSATVPNSSS
jgi:site-specific recombinase